MSRQFFTSLTICILLVLATFFLAMKVSGAENNKAKTLDTNIAGVQVYKFKDGNTICYVARSSWDNNLSISCLK